MSMNSRVIAVIAVALTIACSQRVTPEEEYALQEPERPLVPESTIEALRERAAAQQAPPATIEAQRLTGTLNWAPGDDDPPGSSAVLFLFVRPAGAQGGPPLAVRRMSVGELPSDFEISPADAMIAGTEFPASVIVEARVDLDGNAMTDQPGDWTAQSESVAPGTTGIVLELARQS